MKKYKFRLNYRLEKRKTTTGEMPINADITFCSKRIFFYTGYRIDESKWNTDTQQVKRNNFNENGDSASEINNRLTQIRHAVSEVFSRLELEEEEPTTTNVRERLKKELNEEKTNRISVLECYQILIDEREAELKKTPATAMWSIATLKKHKTMKQHLQSFKAKLYFEDIDVDLLAKFEIFLIEKGLSNGSTFKYMKNIKMFLNWATEKGYNKNESYKKYKQRFKDETKAESGVNLFALSESELASIMALETNRPAIERTRDMFVFCCFTGLRYSDVAKLQWRDIVNDNIDVISKKTNQHILIPINNTLRGILAKYETISDGDLVFPKISNQKYNHQLKIVGELAGLTGEWVKVTQCGNNITRESFAKCDCLSSHVARRTFVTYALRCGWQPEAIRAITGHTTSKMMMNYVKMDKDTKREYMNKLDGIELHTPNIKSVYDFNPSIAERERMGLPSTPEQYSAIIKDDLDLVTIHIAAYLLMTKGMNSAKPYIDLLPANRKKEVIQIIMK